MELKAKSRASDCINAMIADWDKVDSVCCSEDDICNLWLLGVFPRGQYECENIHESIWRRVRDAGGEVYRRHIICEDIGRTGLAWAMF